MKFFLVSLMLMGYLFSAQAQPYNTYPPRKADQKSLRLPQKRSDKSSASSSARKYYSSSYSGSTQKSSKSPSLAPPPSAQTQSIYARVSSGRLSGTGPYEVAVPRTNSATQAYIPATAPFPGSQDLAGGHRQGSLKSPRDMEIEKHSPRRAASSSGRNYSQIAKNLGVLKSASEIAQSAYQKSMEGAPKKDKKTKKTSATLYRQRH